MTDLTPSDSTYLRNWAAVPEAYPEARKCLTMAWLSNLRCPDRVNAAPEFIDHSMFDCAGLSNSSPQYQSHLRLVP